MNGKAVLMKVPVILGIASLSLLAGCGGGTASTVNNNPAPTITTISPTSAVAGGAAFTLTINGTNFTAASAVNFGGTARTTTFVSATQLTAAIPAAAIASTGTAAVAVTNPALGGGTSNAVNFTISVPNPVPMISSLSPTSALAGGAAFTLTINGTNFTVASMVNFGGSSPATTFVNSTQLTAAIPAAAIASAGTAVVTVTNPAPGAGASNGVSFAITGGTNPVPMINSLSPSCGPKGQQVLNPFVDGQLLVNGQNFVANSVVRWNGNDRPTTFANSGQLTAQISASDIAAVGTAAVTVFNPAPGGGNSNSSTFTITAGGVSPQSIAVDPNGKFAYVANAGCEAIFGNVSMYTIDTNTGILASIAAPVVPPDEGTRFVTVDHSGNFAYVANWGEGDTVGSISTYTIDATTGALKPTGTICGSCPGLCAPWSEVVHPSGKFLYVADEGGPAPTTVSMFSIDVSTGTLASIGTTAAGGRAISLAVDPSGNFAYVANSSDSPGSIGDVSVYTITTTGTLTSIGKTQAGTDPVSIAVDPGGKFTYVANSGSNDVSMYSINTTGTLTSIGPITAGTKPSSVAVDPLGKFAYVANSGSNDVSMYSINTTTGALTSVGTVAAGSAPTSIAIHPSGKFAYVTNSGSNDVSMYSIDTATGALTLIGTTGT